MDQPPTTLVAGSEPARGGIILAGPPASGKRTVAFALTSLRRSYAHVPALTAARHFVIDAEQTSQKHLDELRSWAQLFHEFSVERAQYVYDRERLERLRVQGRIPVVCVEDVDALPAFERESDDWLAVLLWCPRGRAENRLTRGRPPAEQPATVPRSWTRRWERSLKGLHRGAQRFTVTLRSDRLDAVEAARIVHLAAQASTLTSDSSQADGAPSAPRAR
jgi:hypothetical protein